MQPTKIIITAMSLATAFASDKSYKFDEVMYGICQAGYARRAVACYAETGIAPYVTEYSSATLAMVAACNLSHDGCHALCVWLAKDGYIMDECSASGRLDFCRPNS